MLCMTVQHLPVPMTGMSVQTVTQHIGEEYALFYAVHERAVPTVPMTRMTVQHTDSYTA